MIGIGNPECTVVFCESDRNRVPAGFLPHQRQIGFAIPVEIARQDAHAALGRPGRKTINIAIHDAKAAVAIGEGDGNRVPAGFLPHQRQIGFAIPVEIARQDAHLPQRSPRRKLSDPEIYDAEAAIPIRKGDWNRRPPGLLPDEREIGLTISVKIAVQGFYTARRSPGQERIGYVVTDAKTCVPTRNSRRNGVPFSLLGDQCKIRRWSALPNGFQSIIQAVAVGVAKVEDVPAKLERRTTIAGPDLSFQLETQAVEIMIVKHIIYIEEGAAGGGLQRAGQDLLDTFYTGDERSAFHATVVVVRYNLAPGIEGQ